MVSFKVILGVLFGLLIMSIFGWAIVSFQNNKMSIETARLVTHSHAVLELTDEVSSLCKDVQLESNAFFISGDSLLLQPYLNSRRKIVPRIERLQSLTHDNLNQKLRIDSLLAYAQRLIAFSNSGVIKWRSYTKEELVDRLQTNFQYRQEIRKIIDSIKAEETMLLETRVQAYEKSIFAFNKTFFLLLSGIAVLLATTFFSIRYNFNKRIKAQEDQRKATELFTKLFYESPMGMVISKLDTGKIIDCNNAYVELVKFSKTELIGKTTVELGILGNNGQRNEIVNKVLASGFCGDVEVELRPKDCEPIWVSKSMQLIQINNENCLLSAVLDMTAHKEAEQKIKQALLSQIELSKLKSNFVTLASHEFRTPLTTILSSAFLLDNYSLGEHKEKVSKHVARIKGSVNLLTSILDEFLSLTKIEEGKVAPRKEWINLKENIEDVCNNLKTLARPGQTITYIHLGPEEIYSDPVLLGNIVNNLVSNAIKYSNENDEIVVSSTVNEKVHVCVKDNGIGISKKDQEHLFERFYRASNTGNVQGTGLGLHIMKHYVDMLNGSVEVQSEPGKGSKFKITFQPL
jgi:PAS domain S-box-containing protein